MIEKKTVKEKHKTRLPEKYIRQKGIKLVGEEIKQRIQAKGLKIRRYNNRINQYQQNRLFNNNEGKFYKLVNNEGQSRESELPDKEGTTKFRSEIWGEDKEHNRNTEWFEEVKEETEDILQQERVVITSGRMK